MLTVNHGYRIGGRFIFFLEFSLNHLRNLDFIK
jgi:hypothetical protein